MTGLAFILGGEGLMSSLFTAGEEALARLGLAAIASDAIDTIQPMLNGGAPGPFDAMLVDIDHSPRHLLDPSHVGLYTPEGLRRVGRHLRPGGVFALWSNDPPDDDGVVDAMRFSFATVHAHVVSFWNFLIDDDTSRTIYVTVGPHGPPPSIP